MKQHSCHACEREIVNPFFFNGNVYGSECISKVTGRKAKNVNQRVVVEADKYEFNLVGQYSENIVAWFKGKKYYDMKNERYERIIVKDGVALIALTCYMPFSNAKDIAA